MYSRLDAYHRRAPVILGLLTLAGVVILLALDTFSALASTSSHNALAALTLVMIAAAYLVYQSAHRPPIREWIKAVLLAIAFLFWAANQVWPDPRTATAFNDMAIGLFVLDVFLVMVGWPASSPDESFAETVSGGEEALPPVDDRQADR